MSGATKVKGRVVSEEAEEGDYQEPRIRRAFVIVNEKQHHESEDGVLFTLLR